MLDKPLTVDTDGKIDAPIGIFGVGGAGGGNDDKSDALLDTMLGGVNIDNGR